VHPFPPAFRLGCVITSPITTPYFRLGYYFRVLVKSYLILVPGRRSEATAQLRPGWYRPSVGVPGT
jgi:hypothetical protein